MNDSLARLPNRLSVWRERWKFLRKRVTIILVLGVFLDALLVAYPLIHRILADEHLSWLSQRHGAVSSRPLVCWTCLGWRWRWVWR